MTRRLLSLTAAALLLAACGNAQPSPTASAGAVTPASTEAALATATPFPTVAATGAFEGQAFSLDLPDGWQTFDLSDPAGSAALDAFVAANPGMAGSIAAFKNLPNVTMAVNTLLGNVVVALSLPTGGATLDLLATTFTNQFAAVPGVTTPPVAENVTLPVGPAVHWNIRIQANKPSGGTYEVGESVYLVANATTAVLVEFVEVGGAASPQEQQIVDSLAFTP